MVKGNKRLKALVTCGASYVPIDDVRVISNISTGEAGHLITQTLLDNQVDVTLIEGPVTHHWEDVRVKRLRYTFLKDLIRVFQRELKKNYDIVVHAAAVSDFEVAGKIVGKLDSSTVPAIQLRATPKLINESRKRLPKATVVGFKLQTSLNRAVQESSILFQKAECDFVVANTLKGGYKAVILDKQKLILKINSKKMLAVELVKLLLNTK